MLRTPLRLQVLGLGQAMMGSALFEPQTPVGPVPICARLFILSIVDGRAIALELQGDVEHSMLTKNELRS